MASKLIPQMKAKSARAMRALAIAPIPVRTTINFAAASANSSTLKLDELPVVSGRVRWALVTRFDSGPQTFRATLESH